MQQCYLQEIPGTGYIASFPHDCILLFETHPSLAVILNYCTFNQLASLPVTEQHSIKELQQKIAAGDQSAYRQLFISYYGGLFRFVKMFTKNKELSEEIVSDVFIHIWKRRSGIEKIKNLKLYLFISAKNLAFGRLTRINKKKFIDLDSVMAEPEDPFNNPDEVLITREINSKLKSAIHELPPRCRLIFKLVKEDGLKYKEVSELLDISIKTVEAQMAIAFRRIGRCLHLDVRQSEKTAVPKK